MILLLLHQLNRFQLKEKRKLHLQTHLNLQILMTIYHFDFFVTDKKRGTE